jgi:hypothetical protein
MTDLKDIYPQACEALHAIYRVNHCRPISDEEYANKVSKKRSLMTPLLTKIRKLDILGRISKLESNTRSMSPCDFDSFQFIKDKIIFLSIPEPKMYPIYGTDVHLEPIILFTKILEHPAHYLIAMDEVSLKDKNPLIYERFVRNLYQACDEMNAELRVYEVYYGSA